MALARSWNFPAEIKLEIPSMQSEGYGYTQKTYLIDAKGNRKNMRFRLHGRKDSPIINPAFVIQNPGLVDIRLKINGKTFNRGKDFRYAVEYNA